MPIITQTPSAVIQESITVLTGPHEESNEDTSAGMEDNDEDDTEEPYEMRF